MNRAVAFFDFDGTLTYRDTLMPFLQMLRGQPRFSIDLIKVSPWLAGYGLRLVKNDKAKQILLGQSLSSYQLDELEAYGQRFAEEKLPGMIRPDVFERLQQHKHKGDCCVLVSASLDIYLKPWISDNSLDFYITSSLEMDSDGNVTGKLKRGNCYGEEKVKRIQELIQKIGAPSRTYAYGNSKGDIPMLNFVNEGYWVNSKITRFK